MSDPAKAEKNCTNLNNIIPVPTAFGDKNYRFFTLPIEQIPGYDENLPQILVHRPKCGLQWLSLELCLPVVTCVKLETSQLVAERRNILVIKDFDKDNCTIELTDCESTGSGG